MSIVRWDEFATLTKPSERSAVDSPARELVAEGTLAEIVTILSRIDLVSRNEMMISLPDRHIPPIAYEPSDFIDLLFRRDRPKSR